MKRKAAIVVGILLSAMVLLNAAPAAATHSVLCKENVGVCPEGSQWPAKTYVTSATGFTGSYAEFELPGLVTFSSCAAGKFSGTPEPQAEGPMTGTLGMFFFTSCKPEGCKVESWTGWAWEWSATGGGNGAIAVSKPDLTATCTKTPFAFSCEYSAATLSAKIEASTKTETAFI
ncbi:MAG TPA: hypothetical protein VNR67_09470 [Solirubrobacterales bacterium]|nr:hypothetical protein [Solirubrobacterales bacterium]